MEGLGGFEVSALEAALAVGLMLAAGIAGFACRQLFDRRKPVDPLAGLFDRSTLESEIATATRRSDKATATGAVLRGRIDHLERCPQIWGQSSRAEAIRQVAQIMRAGVREGDTILADTEGDGSFAIHARDADEADAGLIARRLLKTIEETGLPALHTGAGAKARIEVAPGEWEEVRLLPPPSPATSPAVSDRKVA